MGRDVFSEEIDKIKIWLERQGYSKYSIKGYISDFRCFFKWLEEIETPPSKDGGIKS